MKTKEVLSITGKAKMQYHFGDFYLDNYLQNLLGLLWEKTVPKYFLEAPSKISCCWNYLYFNLYLGGRG